MSSPQDSISPTTMSSPASRHVSHIIGAEDDYFDSDQEQVLTVLYNTAKPSGLQVPHTWVCTETAYKIFQITLSPANVANCVSDKWSV